MDVPKYRVAFKRRYESTLSLYKRCKKIKAEEKLSGYSIYTPSKSIATKHSVSAMFYSYMILMKAPRAKSNEFFNNGEYEKHAAEFVEKIKAMDPICISCNGVYCEDGVHYRKEAALYYESDAMKSMHGFQTYYNYNNVDVMVNKTHMNPAQWAKYLPDDRYYVALCCPRIRVLFPEPDLRDIDHDRWFSHMKASYLTKMFYVKSPKNYYLRKDTLDKIQCEIASIYDQFSDSEKLMLELDM